LDPRLKRHPLVLARINYAQTLLESRLEFALLDAFEDDKEAPATADAGAGEPQVPLLYPMRRFSSSTEPSAAHAAAAPLLPLFAPAGLHKTAQEKTRELAVATVAAWVFSPDVNAPVMGAGSSAFNLLDF